MSIKYSIAKLRNPQAPEEPRKYYACTQIREEVGIDQVAEDIAFASSLTEGDVLNVLRTLSQVVVKRLADGDLVDLGDLGRFYFKVSSKGADTLKEFTDANIRRVRLNYRPGMLFRKQPSELAFENVISRKALDEAKRNEKLRQEQEETEKP